jgi:hypothetical protein
MIDKKSATSATAFPIRFISFTLKKSVLSIKQEAAAY